MAFIDFQQIPARVNREKLLEELAALGVDVVFVVDACTRTEADGSVVSVPPFVQVKVPDGVSEEQVQAVLDAHAPEKSDAEVVEEEVTKKRGAMRAELRAYMVEFLQDPQLLGMLKQALAK